MSLRRQPCVASLAVPSVLCADATRAQGKHTDLAAVAAVIHHVASHVLGNPPQRVLDTDRFSSRLTLAQAGGR
jgi:hypothetical protein